MDFDLKNLTPDIRHLKEMEKVVYDKEWFNQAGDFELYYMYRGLKESDGIRYDITVIPARMMGKEFSKTKGHYHIGKYQEVYTVLEGESIYLMQKTFFDSSEEKKYDEIEDVYAVKCKKGDVIVIPSDYGHITINPSSTKELKMANWISKDCQSDYNPFEKLAGACWYYTTEGWIKNKNYKSVPQLRFQEPLKSIPENLDFLKAD